MRTSDIRGSLLFLCCATLPVLHVDVLRTTYTPPATDSLFVPVAFIGGTSCGFGSRGDTACVFTLPSPFTGTAFLVVEFLQHHSGCGTHMMCVWFPRWLSEAEPYTLTATTFLSCLSCSSTVVLICGPKCFHHSGGCLEQAVRARIVFSVSVSLRGILRSLFPSCEDSFSSVVLHRVDSHVGCWEQPWDFLRASNSTRNCDDGRFSKHPRFTSTA